MKALAQTAKQDTLDRAAMVLSGLCLIHCTVLPIGLALLQAYGASLVPQSLDNGWFHAAMAVTLLGVGGLAFGQGYLRHHRLFPLVAGTIGTALLFVGAFGGHGSELIEHGLTILGTVILLVAHAKNRRPLANHHHHDGNCRH